MKRTYIFAVSTGSVSTRLPREDPHAAGGPGHLEAPDARGVGGADALATVARKVRRTQRGNNNAYCQDNEISWFDWTLLERYADLHRFAKTLIRQRLMLGDVLGRAGLSLTESLHQAQIQPHGVRVNWSRMA